MGKSRNNKQNSSSKLLIHPNSRKAQKITKQTIRNETKQKKKLESSLKRNIFGEKLIWFKENLDAITIRYSPEQLEQLIIKYLNRFENELEQIDIKHSIGGQRKNRQYASRQDAIEMTLKREKNEFQTCGIEMVDITSSEQLILLREWNGNLGSLNLFKFKLFNKKYFENCKK